MADVGDAQKSRAYAEHMRKHSTTHNTMNVVCGLLRRVTRVRLVGGKDSSNVWAMLRSVARHHADGSVGKKAYNLWVDIKLY